MNLGNYLLYYQDFIRFFVWGGRTPCGILDHTHFSVLAKNLHALCCKVQSPNIWNNILVALNSGGALVHVT